MFNVYHFLDKQTIELFKEVITTYHNQTCIKFVPRTSSDENFIAIQNSKSGCWSSVGRIGGRQVSIAT